VVCADIGHCEFAESLLDDGDDGDDEGEGDDPELLIW